MFKKNIVDMMMDKEEGTVEGPSGSLYPHKYHNHSPYNF